jgi:hypothetical protein
MRGEWKDSARRRRFGCRVTTSDDWQKGCHAPLASGWWLGGRDHQDRAAEADDVLGDRRGEPFGSRERDSLHGLDGGRMPIDRRCAGRGL